MNKQIKAIMDRNERVSTDKAWETSATRKIIIASFTYVIVTVFLTIIDNSSPYINALVPAVGYLLSTLSLPIIRNFWVKHIHRK